MSDLSNYYLFINMYKNKGIMCIGIMIIMILLLYVSFFALFWHFFTSFFQEKPSIAIIVMAIIGITSIIGSFFTRAEL